MALAKTIERRVTDHNTPANRFLDPLKQRHASRSPHPYHRRGSSLLEPDHVANAWTTKNYANGRAKVSTRSSSDSGSEADTEAAAVLKGLPAPPLRPRKGLRLAQQDGIESPLVTPSLLDDERHITRLEAPGPVPSALKNAEVDEETRKIREKYTKRKRGEILRRLSEIALLCTVGAIVFHGLEAKDVILEWRQEMLSFFTLTIVLFALYPLRILSQTSAAVRRPSLTIPATFDPAPVLYPIFLPVLVAMSLSRRTTNFILPNIVLGLSSLPPPLIPYYLSSTGFSSAHWAVASLPLIVSQNSVTQLRPSKPLALKSHPRDVSDPDVLILLYPLQQMLVPTIEYLTTTSLLPAELHLLSTAMINLFLFARSPQSEILKALLWLGGISIFVTCQHVLRWEVALARVPSWRFRRSANRRGSGMKIVALIDGYVCQLLSRLGRQTPKEDSSDSDAPDESTHGLSRNGQPRELKVEPYQIEPSCPEDGMPASAIDRIGNAIESGFKRSGPTFSHQRRHTFTTFEGTFKPPSRTRTTPSGRPKRSVTPSTQSLLSLTAAQAQVRKWVYACWAYIAAVTTIFIPVRRYVSLRALQGQEPLGWALSYLLGDIPLFRSYVLRCGLEQWIPLPPNASDSTAACHLGLVEHLRHDTFGEANTRLLLCAYCALILAVGMAVVLELSTVVEVDTRRKVFHGMMVAMFLPTVFVDPGFTALALSLILAIFLLLDLFRASQLPPISRPLTHFLAPYVDGRDHRGPVIVSHIFLLIGCAIPLWMSLAGSECTDKAPWTGWNIIGRDLSMVSGVICVGMGDAAASLIGRRYGRHKWPWAGGKSLEGSFAFAVVVTAGLLAAHIWRAVGGWAISEQTVWFEVCGKAAVAASGASLTESILTGANDNVVVPMMLWLLVRGLGL